MAYKTDYIEYYNMDEPILKYPDIYDDNDIENNKEKNKAKINRSDKPTDYDYDNDNNGNNKPKSFYTKIKYHIGLFIKKIYNLCNKLFHR